MNKRIIIGFSLLIVIIAGFSYLFFPDKTSESFEVNTLLLKYSLKQGEEITTGFTIFNKEDKEETFKINSKNLKGLVQINPSEFKVNARGKKEILINFEDENLTYGPGVYIGSLIVQSERDKKNIPVILEIRSNNPLFVLDLKIAPEYKQTSPGENLFIEVSAFNLNDTNEHAVTVSYLVYNLDSELLLSEEESMVLGGSQTSFTKTLTLPKNTEFGDYVLAVLIGGREDMMSSSNYLFSVSKKERQSTNVSFTYLMIIVFALFLIVFLVIIFLIYERIAIVGELRRQQRREIHSVSFALKRERLRRLSQARTKEQRKKIKKKFKHLHKKALKKIVHKYQERKKTVQSLKKAKKHDLIKKKLKQWKEEGYDIKELGLGDVLGSKKFSAQNLEKQGYDTSVLTG